MSTVYVEELKRELTSFQFEVWNGRGLHPNLCKYYQDLWKSEAKLMELPETKNISVQIELKETKRPNKCEFLEKRTEFKVGCRGWRCAHACEKSLPAVPGVYCQTCTEYVDSGEPFYSGGS